MQKKKISEILSGGGGGGRVSRWGVSGVLEESDGGTTLFVASLQV